MDQPWKRGVPALLLAAVVALLPACGDGGDAQEEHSPLPPQTEPVQEEDLTPPAEEQPSPAEEEVYEDDS